MHHGACVHGGCCQFSTLTIHTCTTPSSIHDSMTENHCGKKASNHAYDAVCAESGTWVGG
jgi:hypothetical protein